MRAREILALGVAIAAVVAAWKHGRAAQLRADTDFLEVMGMGDGLVDEEPSPRGPTVH